MPDKHPARTILVPVVIAFACGIGWSASGTAWPDRTLRLLALVPVFPLLALHLRRGPFPTGDLLTSLLLAGFFFLLGVLHGHPVPIPPEGPTHIYNLARERTQGTLSGTLVRTPALQENGKRRITTRLTMSVDGFCPASGCSGNFRQADGLVQLKLLAPPPPGLVPGERFLARTMLSRVYSFSVPGTFDYRRYLAGKNIWVTGLVRQAQHLMPVRSLEETGTADRLLRLRYLPERLRHLLAAFVDRTLGPRAGGLYKAILIGDRSGVSPDTIEHFTGAGCVHLLAISGMHVGLLAALSLAVLTWLLKRSSRVMLHLPVKKTAVFLSLFPLTVYALVAGFHTPVVRALLMTAAVAFSLLLDRRHTLVANIALAAFLILVWQPEALFTASFQLSFSAVLAIAVALPAIVKSPSLGGRLGGDDSPRSTSALQRAGKWLLAGLAVSVAAVAGSGPLIIYHFNRLSLATPLANLLVEPLVCLWSLTCGLAASLILPFWSAAAEQLFYFGSLGLLAADRVCAFFSGLPAAQLWFSRPSLYQLIAYYTLVAALFAAGKAPSGRQRTFRRCTAVIALAILIALPLYRKRHRHLTSEARITILDVGQGNATLLELPAGRTVLVDGGGPATTRFNVGDSLLAPFLWSRGITRLDSLVISHPHADHYNGLYTIIERFRPATLWINGQVSTDNDHYRALLRLAGSHGTALAVPGPGTVLLEYGGTRLSCIQGPGGKKRDGKPIPAANANRLSLVLRLTVDGASLLLPGDLDLEGERKLLARQAALKADILLAPHHGSGRSNSLEFLAAVAPRYVVVSAGRFNPFHFPAPVLKKRCRQLDAAMYTTPEHGTITFTAAADGLDVSTYQVNRLETVNP